MDILFVDSNGTFFQLNRANNVDIEIKIDMYSNHDADLALSIVLALKEHFSHSLFPFVYFQNHILSWRYLSQPPEKCCHLRPQNRNIFDIDIK